MRRFLVFVAVLCVIGVVIPRAAAKPPADQRLKSFAAPGKKWSLALDLKGYKIERDEVDAKSKKRYVLASNDRTGLTVSFWIEPMREDMDSKACREWAWGKEVKSPFKKDDIKMWELGELAVVEYVISVGEGQALQQKNYRAYLTHDHAWIDIHISKMDATAKDEARVRKLLKSVRIEKGKSKSATTAPSETSAVPADFMKASQRYLKKDYKQAAIYYQRVLDAEKKSRTLDKKLWRVLVDNLGMCYGMTGKLKQAKEVFEYGIGEDPKYPMFHYNLACAFAETGDIESALACLEKAIKYKANMNDGEDFPDPRKDDSFRKYRDDKRFLEIVKKLDN